MFDCFQDTLDFVSYVAKDPEYGRACHVLECGGGLAEDVVTTIGQAFELRFKQYLKKQPKTIQLPHRWVIAALDSKIMVHLSVSLSCPYCPE